MIKKKILIATGGTGGHIFPALSLAKYFTNENFEIEISSDKRGLKFLKDSKNINLVKISSSPIIKKTFFKFLISLFQIFFSIIKSIVYLALNRPSIVFGMGGYSSFPICIAASILRIKFVIYENNLIIGKANKYLLPFTEKIFVSYKELEGISKKYDDKVEEIGNIVREEILYSRLASQNNKSETMKILVLGGSQAARVFADKLPQVFGKLKEKNFSLKVYQQCLHEQNYQLSEFYKKAKIDYEIFNFTNNIIDFYSKVNLVITRSGASVLGELINLKMPFISIPLPTSTDNHQYKNAEFYSKKGYGYLLEEKEINERLYDLIKSFLSDKTMIDNLLAKQRQYSDKDIFINLHNQIKKILNGKN
tara:strand:+ start:658 stop:1749 length:1092 start_codon:yes stop_codon:yes gene_type:complete